MADIITFHLDDDNDPIAQIVLPTGKTVALRWIDEDDNLPRDEETLRALADRCLDALSAETLEAIEETVVRELTEAAFEEGDREIEEEDYRKLAGDMDLTAVAVFTDEVVTLEFEAPREFPDLTIFVQLNEEYEVDELLVE